MAGPVLKIPLAPLEKILLSQVARIADLEITTPLASDPDEIVFRAWNWTSLVYRCLRDDLNSENVAEDYNGDHGLAYREFLHFLAHQGLLADSQFRSDALKAANPDFPEVFTQHSIDSIEAGIYPDDREAWSIVSWMFQMGHLYWDPPSLTRPGGTYDIFKSVYTFQQRQERAGNFQDIESHVATHPALLEQWTVRPVQPIEDTDGESDANGGLSPQKIGEGFSLHPKNIAAESWPPGEPRDESRNPTNAWLKHALRTLYSEQAVKGVLENVCMLLYADLREVPRERLEQSGVDYSVPFMDRDNLNKLRWVVWRPAFQTAMGAHLLYTEDEVYQYCLRNDWYFPDHFCDGEVLFAIHPVEDTDFFAKIKEFWSLWNDCCLSWDAQGKQLNLLQTIPGLRYRSRRKFQDQQIAQRYFRNLVEDHAAGRLVDSTMQDLLGTDYYKTKFAHSLRYIPSDQITVCPDSFLGEGRNGKVYRAEWTRPDSVLATSLRGQTVDVALKELNTKGMSMKFARELDLTYTSLGGSSAGCVAFFGISTVSGLGTPSRSLETSTDEASKFVLVSECANLGNISDFLCEELPKRTFQESWILILDMLSGIANGIHTLHKHGVIHRDLHLNNILVTKKVFPDQPQDYSTEISARVADIGEGQHAADTGIFKASVKARDFHAPEILSSRTWSPAADIFAFAVATCKILCKRQKLCQEPPPEHVLKQAGSGSKSVDDGSSVLPRKLSQIITSGLKKDPGERWAIKTCIDVLEDLGDDFSSEKDQGDVLHVEWVRLDWWAAYAEAFERTLVRRENAQSSSDVSDAT